MNALEIIADEETRPVSQLALAIIVENLRQRGITKPMDNEKT